MCYWEKRWLFSIGNGAKIRPLEKGRKCPDVRANMVNRYTMYSTMFVVHPIVMNNCVISETCYKGTFLQIKEL